MSEKMKVLIADSLDKGAIEELSKHPALEVVVKDKLTPDELVAEIAPYDAVVIRSATRITRPVIEAGKKLKLIARAGVGLDNVDQVAAKERNINVRNTPDCTTISVAELAMGLMLGLARHIPAADASMKTGAWDKKSFTGTELYGKTLGLIGTGRIGQATAQRAKAFGMTVLGFDKIMKTSPIPEIKMVAFDEVLAKSDYISLHIPFIKEDGATIGVEQFNKLKKGVKIINCARGGTVDEAALLAALEDGRVSGAAIDVWAKEPTENQALAKHPKVVALPHLGASAKEGQARAGVDVAAIVIDVLTHGH